MTREKVHVTQLSFASSFLFAKRLGAQVVLHTDRLGAMMLSDIPYDNVYVYLDDLPKGIAPFWAFGKLYATAREQLGSIHIDGDVFLKEQSLTSLFDGKYDLLVQNEEGEKWRIDNTYAYSQTAIGAENMTSGCHIGYPLSYNCGVTQFMNANLKKAYIDMYFATVDKVLHDPTYFQRADKILNDPRRKGFICPDIVVEQQCLHEIATRMQANVKVVLDGDINECAERIGYCHLLSSNKYKMQDELNGLLKQLDPELHTKVTSNVVWKSNS